MPGDKVCYVGQKFSQELGMRIGEVIAILKDSPNKIVVDFGDEQAYLLNSSSLKRPHPSREKEFALNRKHRDED